jgi:hypothetical protein
MKDAILVAQSLGVDHLWIDSICIVQDSLQDLHTEMMVMLEVYANAFFVISATSAASAYDGFLNQRDIGPKILISRQAPKGSTRRESHIVICTRTVECGGFADTFWTKGVGSSPWNQRAWTLQEALTARRIIHFAKERLFFECSTLDCFEGGDLSGRPSKYASTAVISPGDDSYASQTFLRQQAALNSEHNAIDWNRIEEIYCEYYYIVRRYSVRKLTFIEDKAAAFSSIIRAVTRLTGTEVRHGILMNDIRRGLLWRPGTRESTTRLNLWPSWSWLSWNGKVDFTFTSGSSPQAEERVRHQLLPNIPRRTSELEELITAHNIDKELHIHGFILEATVTMLGPVFQLIIKGKDVGSPRFDDFDGHNPGDAFQSGMTVILLSFGESEDEIGGVYQDFLSCCFQGLVLLSNDDGSFRRIGTFWLHNKWTRQGKKEDLIKVFKDVPRTWVTLV